MEEVTLPTFLLTKHKSFLKASLNVLPDGYSTLDNSRLTLLFFTLSGLDILDALSELTESQRQIAVKWIYSLQVNSENNVPKYCGFRGSKSNCGAPSSRCHQYDNGHIAMTYTGLACLLILGDDLSRVDRDAVLAGIRACQLPNGSFTSIADGSESDMRFVFCATAICYLLNGWSSVDVERIVQYIVQCINYDGGFGQAPNLESHGGSTYCAVAALSLMGKLTGSAPALSTSQIERLKRWCIYKQSRGFHGRTNKDDDSCYTFWIGATLKLLDALPLVSQKRLIHFTLRTQDDVIGGFGKHEEDMPDSLHTYLSLAGLSLLQLPGILPLNPAVNISERALANLKPEARNNLC